MLATWILFKTQLDIIESMVRSITDIIWTGSHRMRALSRGDVRIVDYQLSGNNDPAFELGDIAAEADFDPDRTAALTAAYFGAETAPGLVARVRLNLVLSNVTWSLWFSVHHSLLRKPGSTFDYREEAADKWAQAVRDLDDPELGKLIDGASGRSPLPYP